MGKGLSALLENANTDITTADGAVLGSIAEIPLAGIEANPFQPRTEFDEEALNDLAESIKVHGVIQPITVRKLGYDKYQIICKSNRQHYQHQLPKHAYKISSTLDGSI